jgi:hypothetical protein
LEVHLDGLPVHSISEEEAVWVERAFEEMEVFEVMKDLNGDKVSGLDNFSMAFLQSCWDVIKVFLKWRKQKQKTKTKKKKKQKKKKERKFNATFISLVPKKVGAVKVKDFRPIILVSGIYKIIVMFLANRLKIVLENIISKS